MGIVGAASGLLIALLAFALSRAPGWRELRSFSLVALAAAAYCFFNLVHVIPVTERVMLIGESFALAAVLAYGLAWIRHFAIADGRTLRRGERIVLYIGITVVGVAAIPGLLVTPPFREVSVAWLGTTYTMGTAQPLAVIFIVFVIGAMLVAAFGKGRRWRDGWHARLPMLGASMLALAGVADTSAWLNVVSMPQLTEAVSVLVVCALGISYVQRFIADARSFEALSNKLEQEVTTRSSELVRAQAVIAEHERLAQLGRIAAGVAHEINNPTQVIQLNLTWARALLTDSAHLTPELATSLERSHAATQRIAEIVRQLLEASRPTTDVMSAAPFALGPVVRGAVAAAAATVPELGITISIDEAIYVRGIPSYLEQVLINLLVNAAHAAQDVPSGARARVEARRDFDRVRISVIDNGTGIPSTIRDRMFEPFATTKPVGEGTGLGLAVSRGMMSRQGGVLEVGRSGAGGTEMLLELPAAEAIDLEAAVVSTRAQTPSDVRVLVIDDDDDIREMLGLQLDRYFAVEAAATVAEALEMVGSQPYDVVLCDVMMPDGGAEAWFQRCGKVDTTLPNRTILLTAGPTTEEAAALVDGHRERVLFKPVDLEALCPMIERVAR